MLFNLGELMWLSYIPCGLLPDWGNQYNCIEASLASSCPSLTEQKCGLCLITTWCYVEFKQTIKHYMGSLSALLPTFELFLLKWLVCHPPSSLLSIDLFKRAHYIFLSLWLDITFPWGLRLTLVLLHFLKINKKFEGWIL